MDKPIIAYFLIGGFTSAELIESVEKYMKEGWQPLGSPFVINNEVVQSVVKYDNIPSILTHSDENQEEG